MTRFQRNEWGYYAKANDLASMMPEDWLHARLRELAAGSAAVLLESDLEAKFARVAAPAIRASIGVALGWRVLDDGRRTVLLDEVGEIQIDLNLVATEGRSQEEIRGAIQEYTAGAYVEPSFERSEEGGLLGLRVRDVVLNEERTEHMHWLAPWVDDSAVLRVRVCADTDSMAWAVGYGRLILQSVTQSVSYDDFARALDPYAPADEAKAAYFRYRVWMQTLKAEVLEREDRLEEAEQLLRDKIASIGCAISIAEMYRKRWERLRETEPAKAREARRRAAEWARTYASWATSGGEGAALSGERDEFLRLLGPEPLE
jgi:hypothetical protein